MDGLWLRRTSRAYVRIAHSCRQGIHFRRNGFIVERFSDVKNQGIFTVQTKPNPEIGWRARATRKCGNF